LSWLLFIDLKQPCFFTTQCHKRIEFGDYQFLMKY